MVSSVFGGMDISALERRIELGNVYEVARIITAVPNLGGIADWVFKTNGRPVILETLQIIPNGNEMILMPHMSPSFTGGTALVATPRNGLVVKTPAASVIQSPTVTDPGTPTQDFFLPGVSGPGVNNSGIFSVDQVTRIVAPGTEVLIRVQNNGDNISADIGLILSWAELG